MLYLLINEMRYTIAILSILFFSVVSADGHLQSEKEVLTSNILLAIVLPYNSLNLLPSNIHNYLLTNYENLYREDYEILYSFFKIQFFNLFEPSILYFFNGKNIFGIFSQSPYACLKKSFDKFGTG